MKLALIRKTRETSSTNFYFKSCFFLQKWTENDLEIGHFEKMTLFKEENERYYKAQFFACCKQANNFPKVKTPAYSFAGTYDTYKVNLCILFEVSKKTAGNFLGVPRQ